MTRFLPALAFAAVCSVGLTAATAAQAANEAAKWFVLRNDTTSQCWVDKLIRMNGQYASNTAQLASKPFDKKEEAEQRLATLKTVGSCVAS